MSKMKIKTNFSQGDKLPAQELNNNFSVIEECINNTERGLSAYEQAVTQGFEGSQKEWLDSLRGPQGPVGEQGIAGKDSARTRGYTFVSLSQNAQVQGENNYFSEGTLGPNPLGTQLITENEKLYLNINTEGVSFLNFSYSDYYFHSRVTEENIKINQAEFIVEVYSEDKTQPLKTYKTVHDIAKNKEYSLFDDKVTFTGSLTADILVDVRSIGTCNLAIKINAFNYNNGEKQAGSLGYVSNSIIFIEAIS